jgi:hypothetical protein
MARTRLVVAGLNLSRLSLFRTAISFVSTLQSSSLYIFDMGFLEDELANLGQRCSALFAPHGLQ